MRLTQEHLGYLAVPLTRPVSLARLEAIAEEVTALRLLAPNGATSAEGELVIAAAVAAANARLAEIEAGRQGLQ